MHKFITIGLLFISLSGFGQARRALSLMDKLKYEAAFELLQNGLSKDTTSASTPYVLANLYLVNAWPQASLDSAYYYSILSLKKYDQLSEKKLDKHIKEGFGKTRLVLLKEEIDSLAFIVAKTKGTELDYQRYMNIHIDAKELDSALFLRNEQAFKTATATNTLRSYKYFLDTYPLAKDWPSANTQYQKILYAENTSSGKLNAYKTFVNTYPNSPYYEEAVGHIFNIKIGRNSVESMLNFIEAYPTSNKAISATGLLYHCHIEHAPATSFADKYPKITIGDSLKNVIDKQQRIFVPIWNSPYFQLTNLNQKILIDSLKSIAENTINLDFVSIKKGGVKSLIGINEAKFYSGNWHSFQKEERGFIFLNDDDNTFIVHKVGLVISKDSKAELVGPFISFKNNGFWGLKSITNIELLNPKYDSIWYEQGIIFLSKKEKTSPNNPAVFYPALDGENYTIGPFYEEYEWISDSLLWVNNGDNEGLFSNQMEELVPMEKHRIDMIKTGWSVAQKDKIIIPAFSSSTFTGFKENNFWQIGNLTDTIIVKYKYNKTYNPDEASLLGPSAIIMHWKDSSFVYISDSVRFYKPQNCHVKPLLNQSDKTYYYEVIEEKNKAIMNHEGIKLDLPSYTKIIPLNRFFFQLNTEDSKSLYSYKGEVKIEEIDGVELINDSTFSILRDQHFGIFQPYDSIYIEPVFSKKLVPLTDSLWVVAVDNKLGIVNARNQQLIKPQYDEINYWTNGLIFLKKDLNWNIYNLRESKFTEFGITSFKSITQWDIPAITYQKGVGIGVYDSQKGVILKPTYTAIALEGNASHPYYRGEKHVEEAGLHILLFYNLEGDLLFQNIMDEKAFGKLYGYPEE